MIAILGWITSSMGLMWATQGPLVLFPQSFLIFYFMTSFGSLDLDLWLPKLLYWAWMCFWFYNYKCRMFCIFLFLISLTILFYMWMIVYCYHHAKEHKMSEKNWCYLEIHFFRSIFLKSLLLIPDVLLDFESDCEVLVSLLVEAAFPAAGFLVTDRGISITCVLATPRLKHNSFIFETCPSWQGTVKQ